MNQNEIASSKQPSSKNRRRLFKVLGCFIPLLACGAIIAFYANQIAFGGKIELVSLDFGDGYTISVWSEVDGILDPSWDPGAAVYYEVTRSGSVIKPKLFLTAGWEDFDVRTIYAEDRNLIGIYDGTQWGSFFIIIEKLGEDRWFIGRYVDDEPQSWIARFNRIKQEYPNLPYDYDWLESS